MKILVLILKTLFYISAIMSNLKNTFAKRKEE
jgi:hypothetical protein